MSIISLRFELTILEPQVLICIFNTVPCWSVNFDLDQFVFSSKIFPTKFIPPAFVMVLILAHHYPWVWTLNPWVSGLYVLLIQFNKFLFCLLYLFLIMLPTNFIPLASVMVLILVHHYPWLWTHNPWVTGLYVLRTQVQHGGPKQATVLAISHCNTWTGKAGDKITTWPGFPRSKVRFNCWKDVTLWSWGKYQKCFWWKGDHLKISENFCLFVWLFWFRAFERFLLGYESFK